MRIVIIFLLSILYMCADGQTDDSTRYQWYKTTYGSRMPRGAYDSVFHIPYIDTPSTGAFRPGALVMRPADKKIYRWTGIKWESGGDGGGNLIKKKQISILADSIRLDLAGKTYCKVCDAAFVDKTILNFDDGMCTYYFLDSLSEVGSSINVGWAPPVAYFAPAEGCIYTPFFWYDGVVVRFHVLYVDGTSDQ